MLNDEDDDRHRNVVGEGANYLGVDRWYSHIFKTSGHSSENLEFRVFSVMAVDEIADERH